ncbi:MAG TPA: dihydrodipicolinate synthase family protein [Bryobacteraceae bacterium]|nr:dihydrodipicolinate synthase family protein [Bryobacteraceae bacterium]
MNPIRGILPALATPFDAEGKFRPSSFELLLERVYSAGVHGVYVCGQTGEGLLMPVAQRKAAAEVAVRNSPAGKSVVVHVGAHTTADAVELVRHAASIGAAAISSLPPIGGYSFGEIRAYYEALAAASDLPLLVYFYPDAAPSVSTAAQVLELCQIPGVIGLKFTDFDLYKMETIKRQGVVLLNGRDEVLVAGLLMGADGGIGTFYNLVPELFVQVYEHTAAGRWDAARAVQTRINELIRLVLRFPCLPAVKRMLAWSGIDCGTCIAPRRELTAEETGELAALLGRSSFASSAFASAGR